MDVVNFVNSIYLGDQGCKSILIDGANAEIKMQVTCISRVRSPTWNYYTDEDLENGFIVFEGVRAVRFDPPGLIPNDFINDIRAERLDNDLSKYLIVMSVGSVDAIGNSEEVTIQIWADEMALEDVSAPGVRIRA